MKNVLHKPGLFFRKMILLAKEKNKIPRIKMINGAVVVCFLLLINSVQAQDGNQLVKGKVADEKNEPIAGVTIKIVNTNRGGTTDGEGNFQITASRKDVLQFSFIGYETVERPVGNNTTLNVTMNPSSSSLSEVVVVGYSSKSANQISSSVSVISDEKLNDVTSNELTSLLQGKAPGVLVSTASGDPTSGSRVLIRGAGTINASTSPLYVVDGNIGGTFNPTDVESVTILKDAAATGLYGSRAANGVIIVTTKSGKSGKTRIDFNSTVGISEASNGNFRLMNTQQLYDYQSTFYTPDPAVLKTNTDWFGNAFRTAMVNNHALSASGGTDKTQYYVGGNFYKEEGTLINNDKTGYSFRANLNQKLTEKLKLSVLLNGKFVKDNYNPASTLYDAYVNLPFDSIYSADGTPRDARFGTWYGRDRDNYVHDLQYDFSNARSLSSNGDLNLDYFISKHFTISSYNRATFSNYRSNLYYDKRSKAGATNSGEIHNSQSYDNTLLSSNRIKYSTNFGSHTLTVLGVGEVEKGYSDVISTTGKGLPPGRDALSTATDIIRNPTGGNDEYLFSKYLATVDYSYANKYFAVASFVNEYSSRFGSNNPSANFYQLGASWMISKEDFMSGVKPVTSLKLRASYGTTGNADGIGYYASLGLYTISSDASYAGLPGAAPSQMANPNLTWEKSKSYNVGVDARLLDRIDLSVDVYNKESSALLFFRGLPATSGYGGVYENVGSVRNKGLEFNITTQNFAGKAFTWETNLNMAFNRNKVLEVNEGRTEVNTGARQPIGVGHDMNEWYMPVWAGVNPENGDPLWEKLLFDADGNSYITYTNNYNAATRQYTGESSAPKFSGGLTNTFAYKGFTLSAFLNFVYGNRVYNDSRFFFDSDGLYESYNQMVLADGWSRWSKPGDLATHPKPVHGRSDASNATSTRYLEDGSYLRLRNITLGYNLPPSFLKRAKVANARIFISGDNLWTVTNFSGTDPEVDLSSGISSIKYPISKKILFGLSLGF